MTLPQERASLARRMLATLNAASLGVVLGFALLAAVAFSPIFLVPFPVLLGRLLVLALVLLLTFIAAQHVPDRFVPRWLPRWLLTVLAVGLAAPVTTFAIYVASVGGDLRVFLGSEPRLTGFFLIAFTALVLGLIITLAAQVREREARSRSQALQFELERSRLERQALDARLALLTAQVEPHFLFNTLANVQALVEGHSPRAAPVLASLVEYLRAALPSLHDNDSTLGRELKLVRAYLDLMSMRMPDRLAFEVHSDPALDSQRFPPMALLTLVENAVRHGIDPTLEGGRIEVGSRREAATGALCAWVADTGQGMSEHAAPGSGLSNLRERLQGFFGPGAQLCLSQNMPHGVRAEIVVQP